MKPYRTAVVLGRFQIFHKAHKKLLDEAFTQADHVIVVLGSHRAALNIKNPFTAKEREEMIRRVYPDKDIDFVVVPDRYYNDLLWVQDVLTKVRQTVNARNKNYQPRDICLCGYYKDSSSYYLDYFREAWSFEAHVSKINLSATEIRENYFLGTPNIIDWKRKVPPQVMEYLLDYQKLHPAQYDYFVEEYKFIRNYQLKTQPTAQEIREGKKFPVQYVTVDNIVVQNGHVLMVVRKHMPGRGLWAFPGGFVNPKESLENAALRELKEETTIDLNKSALRRQIVDQHCFDHPERDLRGRIFTHGFFYKLEDNKALPEVKANDDAARAFWVPWDEIIAYSDRVYSDHVHILSYFLNRF